MGLLNSKHEEIKGSDSIRLLEITTVFLSIMFLSVITTSSTEFNEEGPMDAYYTPAKILFVFLQMLNYTKS